jgi:hypothetical protein
VKEALRKNCCLTEGSSILLASKPSRVNKKLKTRFFVSFSAMEKEKKEKGETEKQISPYGRNDYKGK